MKRRWLALALCIALATAVTPQPRVAHAGDEDAAIERFDAEKFWTYAGCAVGIALATTPGGWILVAIACGKAATTFWTR